MTTNAYWSWDAAERRCFEYFQAIIGGLEGVTGFMPEDYPRWATTAEECNNWAFEISGGDRPHIRSPVERGNARTMWMMATFKARFTERQLAKRVACLAWDALPAGVADVATYPMLAGIAQIQPTAYPQLMADVQEIANDQDEGGETRVWTVEIPCWVVFDYMDQYT